MATERQIEANRRNAQRSTGPKTDEGKAASRGNAQTHGLAGAGVVTLNPREIDEIARRTAEWAAVFRPVNRLEGFYVSQYALETVRVERCQSEERMLRCRLAMRAIDEASWDEDRRVDAEEVGARLARDPARTVRRLRRTPQGCDWLIERWEALGRVADAGKAWDEPQRALALDLLGVPAPFRNGPTRIDPDDGGDSHEDVVGHQAALAADRVDELTGHRDETAQPRDDDDREIAMQGVDPGGTALTHSLQLIRRYESACQRRMERSLRLLLEGRLGGSVVAVVAAPAAPSVASQAPSSQPSKPLESAVGSVVVATPVEPTAAARPVASKLSPSPSPSPAPTGGNRRWRRAQQRLARQSAG